MGGVATSQHLKMRMLASFEPFVCPALLFPGQRSSAGSASCRREPRAVTQRGACGSAAAPESRGSTGAPPCPEDSGRGSGRSRGCEPVPRHYPGVSGAGRVPGASGSVGSPGLPAGPAVLSGLHDSHRTRGSSRGPSPRIGPSPRRGPPPAPRFVPALPQRSLTAGEPPQPRLSCGRQRPPAVPGAERGGAAAAEAGGGGGGGGGDGAAGRAAGGDAGIARAAMARGAGPALRLLLPLLQLLALPAGRGNRTGAGKCGLRGPAGAVRPGAPSGRAEGRAGSAMAVPDREGRCGSPPRCLQPETAGDGASHPSAAASWREERAKFIGGAEVRSSGSPAAAPGHGRDEARAVCDGRARPVRGHTEGPAGPSGA